MDQSKLPEHLRDNAPFQTCSYCKRKTWASSEFDMSCNLLQPNGLRCVGVVGSPKKKQRKPRILYIAQRDGRDCGVLHAKDLGLGPALCLKRGLLVPGGTPRLFTSFAEMNRMMTKTQKAYGILKGSMVDQLPRLNALLGVSSAFTFRKVIRKGGKLVDAPNGADQPRPREQSL